MSKSGVFAHFGSREELQISVVREYHAPLRGRGFLPRHVGATRSASPCAPCFDNWMKRTSVEIDSGCIYISGAVEFDDRPGPVRDALASSVSTWLAAMGRAIDIAIEEGHLRADTDAHQMRFEIHSLILALHYEARFLRAPDSLQRALAAFEGIVQRYSAAPTQAAAAPKKPARKPRTAA